MLFLPKADMDHVLLNNVVDMVKMSVPEPVPVGVSFKENTGTAVYL
jgi:hypothetical protein